MVLVVTDDEEGLRARLAELGQESLGAAGVVAITGPRGYGTMRILTELQQAWLLGYGDVSIVSPVSFYAVRDFKPTTESVSTFPYCLFAIPFVGMRARNWRPPFCFLTWELLSATSTRALHLAAFAGFRDRCFGACTHERVPYRDRGQQHRPPVHVFTTLSCGRWPCSGG